MHDQTVTALNALLRGERRSVKCYQRVLRSLPVASAARSAVEECLVSHQGRAIRLKIELARRGDRTVGDSNPGGGLMALLAALLALAWVRLATRLMEVVELRGIARYDRNWEMLDESARDFLTSCLFPQQVLCYQSIALLSKSDRSFAQTPTS
jgi:hypothetical protein